MTVAEEPGDYCFNLLSKTALIKQYVYWPNTVSRHEWQCEKEKHHWTDSNRYWVMSEQQVHLKEVLPVSQPLVVGKGSLIKGSTQWKPSTSSHYTALYFCGVLFLIICFAALSSIAMGSTWCLLKAYIIQGFKVESVKVSIQELLSPRRAAEAALNVTNTNVRQKPTRGRKPSERRDRRSTDGRRLSCASCRATGTRSSVPGQMMSSIKGTGNWNSHRFPFSVITVKADGDASAGTEGITVSVLRMS